MIILEEFEKSIISAPVKTDDIITEVKVMNERFILLTDEVEQLKREIFELSEVIRSFIINLFNITLLM